jgi:hypothetical protein
MIKRIKKHIKEKIRKIIREELEDIFCKHGEIAIDHHTKQNSWAVVKLDTGEKSCYLKFIDLGHADLLEISRYLSKFERSHIDSMPMVETMFNEMGDQKTLFDHDLYI